MTGAVTGVERRVDEEIVERHRGLFLRTVVVSILTLGSRILGMLREVIAAALFGERSGILDAFITAWRIPNLFRRFFGEGALSTSLQTAMTEADGDHGNEAGRRLFLATIRLLSWILLAVTLVAMGLIALVPDHMPFTGWEWLGPDAAAVRGLSIRMMPFVLLVCLTALGAGALQVRGHFFAPSVAPVVLNLVWIATLVAIGFHFGWTGEVEDGAEAARQLVMARWLAWGVLLAGAFQLLVLVPALARKDLLFRRAQGRGADARTNAVSEEEERAQRRSAWAVLSSSAPLALGAAVYQINVMVDGFMAEGLLPDGGPTAHYLANRVQQFPLALIAIAATSSVFPSLKALGHRRRLDELRSLHDRTQMAIAFLALPATFGLVALAGPISSVLFEHGAYGGEGVRRLAAALRMLAIALLPAGAVGLAGRTYYALGDFKTPVRISISMLLTNALLNVAFVVGLGMDADGLALSTALTSWIHLCLLLPGLTGRLGLPMARPGTGRSLSRMLLAALASGGAAFQIEAWLPIGRLDDGTGGAALRLCLAMAGGAIVFAGMARLLGLRELHVALDRLRRARGGG